MRSIERAGLLFDFAVDHPEGFSRRQVCEPYGWSIDQFDKARRTLRLILADDTINLICKAQPGSNPHLYFLVGRPIDGAPWTAARVRDFETRFLSHGAVAQSWVHATDGRSTEGRRARLIDRTIRRLKEDLAELDGRFF